VDFILFPFLAVASAIGTWFLASYLVASLGWQRLAGDFRVERVSQGSVFWLAYLKIDSIKYSGIGVVRATVAADGLGLRVVFLFRLCHPPLLVPWLALGPLVQTKSWWRTTYETTIRTSGGGRVRVRFNNERLFEATQVAGRAAGVK